MYNNNIATGISDERYRYYLTMGKNKPKTKQGKTTKKAIMLKHQVTGKTTTDGAVKIGDEITVLDTWYRIIELQDKQWLNSNRIRYRPAIQSWTRSLRSFETKHLGEKKSY